MSVIATAWLHKRLPPENAAETRVFRNVEHWTAGSRYAIAADQRARNLLQYRLERRGGDTRLCKIVWL
jgi:hypothetical protein